jgi:hypothetical protein
LLLAEFPENFLVVVGNGIELDPGRLEFRMGIAQLTELRPTGRSPDRRAIENDDGESACSVRMEGNFFAPGVWEGEVREAFSYLGASRVVGRQSDASRVAQRRGCIKSKSVSLDRHVSVPDRIG